VAAVLDPAVAGGALGGGQVVAEQEAHHRQLAQYHTLQVRGPIPNGRFQRTLQLMQRPQLALPTDSPIDSPNRLSN